MEEDLEQAQQALVDIKTAAKEVSKYDPSLEIEHNIVSLLRHRIEKLNEDAQFEQEVKNAILARLPEAEFAELIRILDTVQAHANASTGILLSPFVPKAGERVPLLDDKREKKASEEDITNDSRSEDLQAVAELGKLIRLIKEKQQPKKIEQEKINS